MVDPDEAKVQPKHRSVIRAVGTGVITGAADDDPFGQLSGWHALAGLGLQCFWIVSLVVFGRVTMGRTMRSLQVQGG